MSRGVNKVILVGYVGSDPEVKQVKGLQFASLSMGTSEAKKGDTEGEWVQVTEWHRVVFFGGLAGVIERFVKKGSQVYIEGKLQTSRWTDKHGVDRQSTKINGREIVLLSSKRTEEGVRNDANGPASVPVSVPVEGDDVPF